MSAKRSGIEEASLIPPPKQAKSETGDDSCFLCESPCWEKQKELNAEQWKTFQLTAQKWSGLDKFGEVFEKTDWHSGPGGKVWHKKCKLHIAGERKLQQALKRKAPSIASDEEQHASVNNDERPATRQSVGPIHDTSLCIWCMKGLDARHPDRSEKLHVIEKRSTWQRIVASAPHLKEKAMRTRIKNADSFNNRHGVTPPTFRGDLKILRAKIDRGPEEK